VVNGKQEINGNLSTFNRNSIDVGNLFRTDKNKPRTETFRDNFTTAQLRIDTNSRFGMIYIRAVIDNQDPTNNITIRTDPQGQLLTIPPNSVLVIENETHSFLEINPNAVTGVGNFSLETAVEDDLRKSGFLGL